MIKQLSTFLNSPDAKNGQNGQILLLVTIVIGVVLITTLVTIGGAQVYFQNSTYSMQSEKATALAEAGIDKAIAAMNKSGGSYNGEGETSLGDGSYSVSVTTKDAATKIIKSTGYIPNKASALVKRSVQIQAANGTGISFAYGVQVGEGGLELGNSNQINGSIYSNGEVEAGNNNTITGDAWVAGGPQATADQQTNCNGVNCADFLVGTTVGGQQQADVAQSFKPSASGLLNKISIYIKKIGTPPDTTVRILDDNNGQPDKNNVLASGTLYTSLLSASYGWIDVTFNTSPDLNASSSYWIVLDTSLNSTNYLAWQNDLSMSYNQGLPVWSPNWQDNKPVWNKFNGDLLFQTYMGGSPTKISGNNNFNVHGNVHAHAIENLTIGQGAFYQSIVNSTAGSYNPGAADPAPKVFPISDANISDWKNQASTPPTGSVISGDFTTCRDLPPVKISGNFNINSDCTMTIGSPIWVTGNLSLNSNNNIKLNSSYGSSSGVIIVDGTVRINSNNNLLGTGLGNSFLMILSTYDSRSNGVPAITINNSGNTGVFYAGKGIIQPGNNNTFTELTGWGIRIINNSILNYQTGLSSSLFSSGPTGSFSLVKGTYQAF